MDIIKKAMDLCAGASLDINHTRFQLERFVVGAQPTPWSRYRTACIELANRVPNMELLQEKLELEDCHTNKSQYHETSRALAAVKYEIEVLIDIAEKQRALIPNDETWEDHQPEYYLAKLLMEAYYTYICSGRVSPDIMKHASMLPDLQRAEFIQQMHVISSGETPGIIQALQRDLLISKEGL